MNSFIIRNLNSQEYYSVWQAMRNFTDQRSADQQDEIWLVEHPPVYTLGQNSKPEHLLNPGAIPVIQTDRGGQVTYHGPGQQIAYIMIDIQRRRLGVRQLVTKLEQTVIKLLANYNVAATTRKDAPGVYVEQAKICSVGLRIRRGCSYHGLALNVNMDLEPFSRINPCGFAGLKMTQLSNFVTSVEPNEVSQRLIQHLLTTLM